MAISEQDFQNALIEYSENKWKCSLNETSTNSTTNDTMPFEVIGQIICYPYVGKDVASILKLNNHWFRLVLTPLKMNGIGFLSGIF